MTSRLTGYQLDTGHAGGDEGSECVSEGEAMPDSGMIQRLEITRRVAQGLNGIGLEPVLSGSVGLKLAISEETGGRMDDMLSAFEVDDVDLFVPQESLVGVAWKSLSHVMVGNGFARNLSEDAAPHDFVDGRTGIVVSFGAEDWDESMMGPASFVPRCLGGSWIRVIGLGGYERLYSVMADDERRIACGKRDKEKLRLIRQAIAMRDEH